MRVGARICPHGGPRKHGIGVKRILKRFAAKRFRAAGKRDPEDAPRKYSFFKCDCWWW
jgi:hypothetical protein